MTIYSGGMKVDLAQTVLREHTVSSADGLCRTCRHPGPCVQYEQAAKVFSVSLRLPRRTPGLTRPELIGALALRSADQLRRADRAEGRPDGAR